MAAVPTNARSQSIVQADPLVTIQAVPSAHGCNSGMSPDGRIFFAIAFIHEDIADNHYARPVEGLGEIRYFDATLLNAVCSTTTSKLQYF